MTIDANRIWAMMLKVIIVASVPIPQLFDVMPVIAASVKSVGKIIWN
jgi:hypothetical protein